MLTGFSLMPLVLPNIEDAALIVGQTLGLERVLQDPLFTHVIRSIRLRAGRRGTSAAGQGPVVLALRAARCDENAGARRPARPPQPRWSGRRFSKVPHESACLPRIGKTSSIRLQPEMAAMAVPKGQSVRHRRRACLNHRSADSNPSRQPSSWESNHEIFTPNQRVWEAA